MRSSQSKIFIAAVLGAILASLVILISGCGNRIPMPDKITSLLKGELKSEVADIYQKRKAVLAGLGAQAALVSQAAKVYTKKNATKQDYQMAKILMNQAKVLKAKSRPRQLQYQKQLGALYAKVFSLLEKDGYVGSEPGEKKKAKSMIQEKLKAEMDLLAKADSPSDKAKAKSGESKQ